MFSKQLILLLVAVLATASASSVVDKRFIREPGMPIVHLPPGMVSKQAEVPSKRYVRLPGMPAYHGPPNTVALKRGAMSGDKKPMQLQVTAAKFPLRTRSMPLELDQSELASMPKSEQEKFSKRIVIKEPNGHFIRPEPVGSSKIMPMRRYVAVEDDGTVESPSLQHGPARILPQRRYILEGPNGPIYPTSLGAGKVTPMKRYVLEGQDGPIFPATNGNSKFHPMKRSDGLQSPETLVGLYDKEDANVHPLS